MKQWTIIFLILFWLGWRLAVPNDFVRSDLGRHIKNGELILHGNWDVLYKNYYSYTNPQYPFINYHWLFGVFCYVLWHYFGFTGLSFIYLVLELFTFYVFFRCWQRYSSFAMACAIGLLSFPLITLRSEIRPEGISYLFCGLFWWLIDSYQQKQLKSHHLIIVLCALQVIWVNTHIFFILGPMLTFLFWCQARSNGEKQQADVLQRTFFLLLVMCLINPFGLNVLLVPFETWGKASSFKITESLPVFYALNAKIMSDYRPLLLYFLAALGILISALCFLVGREGFKKYIFIGSLTLILSLTAVKAIRMIGLFGYFWIPLSTYVYGRLIQAGTEKFRKNIQIVLVVAGIIVSASVNMDWKQRHVLGIVPGVNDAAEFFKQAKISGPVFNNYSIGGYLIFHLSPGHKLFVDNRGGAAFPEDFFNKTFVPMQLNDDVWHKLDQKYHFNVIFYSPDASDWDGGFIWKRLRDPAWALVFHSDEAVIFLKCNAQNEKLFAQPLCHDQRG
jgi:hypothetical protein